MARVFVERTVHQSSLSQNGFILLFPVLALVFIGRPLRIPRWSHFAIPASVPCHFVRVRDVS